MANAAASLLTLVAISQTGCLGVMSNLMHAVGADMLPAESDHLKEKNANQIDNEYPGKCVSLLKKKNDHQHRKHQPENIEHQFIDQKGLPERMKKLGTGSGQQVPPAKGEQGGFTGPSTGV